MRPIRATGTHAEKITRIDGVEQTYHVAADVDPTQRPDGMGVTSTPVDEHVLSDRVNAARTFTVTVSNQFEAETASDALRQMAAWLDDNAYGAGYRVDDDTTGQSQFIDAEQLPAGEWVATGHSAFRDGTALYYDIADESVIADRFGGNPFDITVGHHNSNDRWMAVVELNDQPMDESAGFADRESAIQWAQSWTPPPFVWTPGSTPEEKVLDPLPQAPSRYAWVEPDGHGKWQAHIANNVTAPITHSFPTEHDAVAYVENWQPPVWESAGTDNPSDTMLGMLPHTDTHWAIVGPDTNGTWTATIINSPDGATSHDVAEETFNSEAAARHYAENWAPPAR